MSFLISASQVRMTFSRADTQITNDRVHFSHGQLRSVLNSTGSSA